MVPSTILKSLKAMPAEWLGPFKSFFLVAPQKLHEKQVGTFDTSARKV